LDACSKKGWLAILDADIALSQNFRVDIENQINLRLIPDKLETKRTIYGLQRYMYWSKPEWKAFLKTGKHKWELDKKRKCAQAPAGYFQLWYAKNQTKLYHEDWAANSNRLIRGGYHRDLDFARQFGHCRHLPCPYVVHLATRTEGMRDYNGRVSTKW